jgi:hypothetical protein
MALSRLPALLSLPAGLRVRHGRTLPFGIGMAVGAVVWGNCNWGGGNVDVDVNRNTNFSRNVNRTEVANNRTARVHEHQSGNRSQWQHNPENRRGVQYRDQSTQQRYNRASNPQATQSREAFRGRAEQGRQDLSRGGGGSFDGGRGQGPGGGQGRGGGGRDAGAFQGMGSGGDIRGSSSRGQASRESMGASRGGGGARAGGGEISAGGRGGGGGGGGARGGGGGGRGGGGRGGRR